MKIALLRVGADSGNLGIHSPLFEDGTFDFIPINDEFNDNPENKKRKIIENRTFENTKVRKDKFLIEYFPPNIKDKHKKSIIHFDPEFVTYTYGDPSFTKSGLMKLQKGDFLVFYSSLTPFPQKDNLEVKLYIIGFFEIEKVISVTDISDYKIILKDFKNNFHVKHYNKFKLDVTTSKNKGLKLVKGTRNSRFLNYAVPISEKIEYGTDNRKRFVVSKEKQKIFGDFNGKICIQRNALRFVKDENVENTYNWIMKLE